MSTESFLAGLPEEPLEAFKVVATRLFEIGEEEYTGEFDDNEFQEIAELYAMLDLLLEESEFASPAHLEFDGNRLKFARQVNEFARAVYSDIVKVEGQSLLSKAVERVRSHRKRSFAYEFSDGDLHRIQSILNELRQRLTKCEALSQEHRDRLLAKLEKLQAELHKRVSSLDSFYGMIFEGVVVLETVGEKAKPIVALVRDLAAILWITQATAEGLPSNAPNVFLPAPEPPALEGPGKP